MIRSDPTLVLLLDGREDSERELARIEPSVHVPTGEIETRFREIPSDLKVVVYCHHGTRSLAVAGFLAAEGYPDVANLEGGAEDWSLWIDPTVPRCS